MSRTRTRTYADAVWQQQKPERDRLSREFRRANPVNPERITAALDCMMMDGPGVDLACGVEEPAVDEWEAGTRIPTPEQIDALARLTGFSADWFHRGPLPDLAGSFYSCKIHGARGTRAD